MITQTGYAINHIDEIAGGRPGASRFPVAVLRADVMLGTRQGECAVLHANIDREFQAITEYWSPRVIAAANGQFVKIAKVKGEFVWHSHADEDEFFLIRRGTLIIRYRGGADVVLGEGDFHVVPRGREHKTEAPDECWVMFVEPAATKHTGDVETPLTKSIDAQVAHLDMIASD
jgi:mannose-6-phosphate isomerase-like protein (cupin superfamily)